MSCSRFAAGSIVWMFSPRSSSAIARSLSWISVPFTRATTASDADDDELAEEEEFLEQPTAAGSTNSANAAIVATVFALGRVASADWKTVKRFGEVDCSNVMAAVPGKCAGLPTGGGGHSPNRF